MRRGDALRVLTEHRDEFRSLGITSLLIFGSVARDEAGPDSDLDLIADFDHPIGYIGLGRVQNRLEEILGCRVDLATRGMIREEFRDRIFSEAVRAA